MGSKKLVYLTVLNFLSLCFALALNYLAVSLPMNGKTTGELSDKYENYFVPAGFTFSIWAVIYISIIVFTIFLTIHAFRRSGYITPFIQRLSVWFIACNLANGMWIIFWHYEWVIFSLLTMLVILFSLLDMYYTMADSRPHRMAVNLCLYAPVSIYLAWISVATIANVTAAFVSVKWDGGFMTADSWAIAMIFIAALLGVMMIYFRQDILYALVIAWALYGIYAKRMALGDAISVQVGKVAQYGFTLLLIYGALALVGRKSYFFDKTAPIKAA
jgi:benzodiazapine receptor